VALAQQRCPSPLETSKLDLFSRSELCRQSRTHPRSLPTIWEGAPLGVDDYIVSADEKTSIQARRRKQPTLPPALNRPTRLTFDVLKVETWVGRMVSEDTVGTNCLLPDCGR